MELTKQQIETDAADMRAIADNIETVVLGKREVIELTVMTLVAGGHILIEDVPGVGKTTLVSALAKSVDCGFSRIQFTPDIMPSDVTGFSIFNQKTREFEFRPGSVMSNIILADEINRASAKTQSSLLEAMEERQVTVDANTYKLKEPFMVLATENPLDSYGTYPLPEAQIDRFMVRLSIGYPGFEEEKRMALLRDKAKKALEPVVTGERITELKADTAGVLVDDTVMSYIVEIITATRDSAELTLGSSPRGTIALMMMAQTCALYRGRGYVIPDDVKYLAPFVLGHRVIVTHDAKARGREPQQIIAELISNIAVPLPGKNEKKTRA